ncbi:S1C family serine protease [Deinococcus hopiensis]|nr:trypsin-like peptidase domain-containing protein [Deinococcus hopiensis]
MNAIRLAASRGLALTLSLLLTAGAQTTPSAAATPGLKSKIQTQEPAKIAPKALSAAEASALRALFQKLRPATLRLEDCPPTNCSDPGGVGTGFLIGDGYALTAYHVVAGSKTLSAQTLDKKRYAVEVVGYDEQADIALLRVNVPGATPFMPLAARGPVIGDPLLGIGNGGGAFLTSKTGRLIGLNADAGRADFPPGTLEMNAPLVPGDSGGPILNAQGEVVGVVSYIRVRGEDNTPDSFAVPITREDARIASFRQGVKRNAPMIGIGLNLPGELQGVSALPAEHFADFSKYFDLGETPGAFFTDVTKNSPAARAGLQPLNYDANGKRLSGDIVTAVNGQRVTNFSDFQYAVRRYQPGDTVTLTVLREGKEIQIKLTLVPSTQVRS